MIIVLVTVSIITYSTVANLLQDNAEEEMTHTVTESLGRFESIYEQINMVSKQVITSDGIQNILLKVEEEEDISFNERQALVNDINMIQANADGIYATEVYTRHYERIIPIDSMNLVERIPIHWVKKAYGAKGKLVWIGEDPLDENYFLAIRSVNLMDRSFQHGGFIILRIDRPLFSLPNTVGGSEEGYTILLDENNEVIISNYQGKDLANIYETSDEQITLDEKEFVIVKSTSPVTGWSLYRLTPVQQLTAGIPTVQAGIVIAGAIGIVIFFISSLFLSTFITRPITRLTQTMREANEGILQHNPPAKSSIEINELNQTYNQLAAETNYLVQMVYEKEIIKSRSELKALQAQIHPHFLFNTLDALYWSLDDKDEEELAETVLAMSELFRYTITKKSDTEWVTIEEELDHIDRYMSIMEMRFGSRLKWEKETNMDVIHAKIPKLMIQPLVENAILHGAEGQIGECTVTVKVEKSNQADRVKISVSDNGKGMSKEKLEEIKQLIKGNIDLKGQYGLALQNVQQRLNLFYDQDKVRGLTIDSVENEGTIISFEIPMEEGNSN